MAPKAAVLVHLVLVPLVILMIHPFSLALTQDFCVADLSHPDTPSGYPCKPKPLVNSSDFYSDALAKPGPIIQPFNIGVAFATVKQYPGVNGLGLAATRFDIRPGGVVPFHTHPEASELLFVVKGTLHAGFISAGTNKPYVKNLNKGDLFMTPQGLLHFQYNTGNSTAIAFNAYSNPNPSVEITDYALFGNTLPADVVAKLTFIVRVEVEKLKRFFGIVRSSHPGVSGGAKARQD